jgi:hypothetical protein
VAREALLKAQMGIGMGFRMGSRGALRLTWPVKPRALPRGQESAGCYTVTFDSIRAKRGSGEARGDLISGFTC